MATTSPKQMKTLLRRSERQIKAAEMALRLAWQHHALLTVGELERAWFYTCDTRTLLEALMADMEEFQQMEHGRVGLEVHRLMDDQPA
jgi:hypothetical protein